MQAHQSPLIVAHESLAGFVRPKLRRPLIAKIHRDLFLNPINDEDGVSTMEDSWKIALKKLFQYFTPIVIGYGGNDGSLMNMLQDLNTDEIAGRMFWCYRGDRKDIPTKVLNVLSKQNGILVKIPSFDGLMIQLAQKLVPTLSVDSIPGELKKLALNRAEQYQDQIEKLAKETNLDKDTASALKDSVNRGKSWWAWQLKANEEQDIAKRDAIFQEGIKEFPGSSELCGNYANFLVDTRKDYDAAEKFYKRAIELDPDDADYLSNYGIFLEEIRKDYESAEKLHTQAIELEPSNATSIGNYAIFLERIKNDYNAAEIRYKESLELAPYDEIFLTNYTSLILRKNDSTSAKLATEQVISVVHLSNQKVNPALLEALLYGSLAFELFPEQGNKYMLSSLKYSLTQDFSRNEWNFEHLFSCVLPKLSNSKQTFYRALGEAILNEKNVDVLNKFPEWQELEAINPFTFFE